MCGLAAYVGESYSPLLFKLVALAQDERGRDNAGVGYVKNGDFYSYLGGVEEARIFKALVEDKVGNSPAYPAKSLAELLGDYEELPDTVDSFIFAHSRKATVGNGTPKNAQPFISSSVMFMHNGTINNHKLFATKYKLPEYTSDSQVGAHMIAQGKEDTFFELYKGTVTCIWGNEYEPNSYYVFSGSDHHYASTPPKPSKALYYLELDNGVYSSTQIKPLQILAELLKVPGRRSYEVKQYSANTIYKVSSDGVTVVRYINRRIKQSQAPAKKETPPEITQNHSYKLLHKELAKLDAEEPDLLQYAAGKYYINGEPATVKYEVDKEGIVNYFPIYVSKYSFLTYKKLKTGEMVTKVTEKRCGENPDNLVAIPLLDGILLEKWSDYFRLVKNYSSITVRDLAVASKLPINIRTFHKSLDSEWFINASGKPINYSVNIPFTQKVYKFRNNKLEVVELMKLATARKVVRRYISKLSGETSKEEEPPTKLRVFIGAMMRVANDSDYTARERLTAFRAAEFINEKMELNDSRVKKPAGVTL